MTLRSVVGAAVDQSLFPPYAEVIEDFIGILRQQSSAQGAARQRSFGANNQNFFSLSNGAPTIIDTVPWGIGVQAVSTATAVTQATQGASVQFQVPLNFSPLNHPTPAAGWRRYLRYTFSLPTRITVLGTGRHCGCGLIEAGASDVSAAATGLLWSSVSTENAGRWTARYRQTAGGPTVNLFDSGIDPTGVVLHVLALRFTESSAADAGQALVEWLMDGQPVARLTAAGVLFDMAGLSNFSLVWGVGPPAGATIQRSIARLLVEQL